MAGKIRVTPCPECRKIGGLHIKIKLVPKPIGSFSLAGAQLKFSVQELPFLECENCNFSLIGKYEDDTHAVFGKPPKED